MFAFQSLLAFTLASMALATPAHMVRQSNVYAPTAMPKNNTGRLPALGWFSSGALGMTVSEDTVIQQAEIMKNLGVGYEYMVIDADWAVAGRDSNNRIVPNATRFPNGIKPLADKLHDMGMKIGLGLDGGSISCDNFSPGSLGYEDIDAQMLNDWGIDYIKYDNCNKPANWTDAPTPPGGDWYNSNSAILYRRMTAAIDKIEQPVLMEMNIQGEAEVWTWGARVSNDWRIQGHGNPTWNYTQWALTTNAMHLDTVDFFAHAYMGPFIIGNGNLTVQEQRSQFALYAAEKSPLLMDTDMTKFGHLEIITNKELIAFNQDDKFGKPAMPYTSSSSTGPTQPPEFYRGDSQAGTHVFVLNVGNATADKTIDFSDFADVEGATGKWILHDMWTGKDSDALTDSYTFSLDSHDTAAFLLKIAN